MKEIRETGRGLTGNLVLTLLLAILIVTGLSIAASVLNPTIPQQGKIGALGAGVYWDSDCTNETVEIDWGILYPNDIKTALTYIRNEGDSPAKLNFNASTPTYLTQTWNYSNIPLNPNEKALIQWTLTVASSAPLNTSFSYALNVWTENP